MVQRRGLRFCCCCCWILLSLILLFVLFLIRIGRGVGIIMINVYYVFFICDWFTMHVYVLLRFTFFRVTLTITTQVHQLDK